jgi:hypothetical protein
MTEADRLKYVRGPWHSEQPRAIQKASNLVEQHVRGLTVHALDGAGDNEAPLVIRRRYTAFVQ